MFNYLKKKPILAKLYLFLSKASSSRGEFKRRNLDLLKRLLISKNIPYAELVKMLGNYLPEFRVSASTISSWSANDDLFLVKINKNDINLAYIFVKLL